ncbi:sugar transferase [Nocardioides aurantiacus]|uniref:Undecaprenyl-phosphate galactose phosphotransferase WbaP/exopolysaccharide biosynthesis polyprenyl glycosylphosphotransferase n=1 Tax=Nocardioides aurantiacus TaxID=86796 RepID=A0A3N2CZA5_9ACTN|nr:sugar transferase [Nocardioides aurantiacus]ROR92524.1 Undecaprenyl-phosphate galactose phosphotransferase WbaP/exopolysaccharide biosynthesis polyprenyl glycosylphosphotransferase [Nocardioides aurantiacus]
MTVQLVHSSTRVARDSHGLKYVPVVAFGLDLVLVTFSVFVAVLGRESIALPGPSASNDVTSTLEVAGPLMMFGWVAVLFLMGAYRLQVFGAGLDEYKRVISGSLVTAAAVTSVCYLASFPLSRVFFLLCFLVGVPVLVTGRLLLRRSLQRARTRGALQHRVLIAGTEGHVDEIASVLARESWLGYRVIGALTPNATAERDATASGVPLVGHSRSLAEVAIEADVDVVFLAGGAFDTSADMRRLAWDLEHEDIEVVIAPSVTDVAAERVSIRPVGGMPLVHLEKPRSREAVRRMKRTFDIVGSLVLLAAFSPVFAFAALKVKLHDGGPVFFRQARAGRDNIMFECLKFRTMVMDAEARLADLHAAAGYEGGLFKLEDDPRITKPGQWLRRFSVDELPQLVNVLKGDMSLVGPRPPLEHEVAQYDDDVARRLRVRPGMTGLWQVSGRSDLSWSEAIRLDLYYVDNWSMVQDLTILFRTFSAVFASRGAY